MLHERQFAGGAESDPATALRLRQALFSVAQPLLSVAREEEEHVALLECVGGHTTTAARSASGVSPTRRCCFTYPLPCSDLVVVWLTVSDLLVFVSGAGVVVDELSRASTRP